MNILVIYHARCPDGIAAAWCARRHFTSHVYTAAQVPNVEYHAAVHGQEPPYDKIRDADKTYILDFSYRRDLLIDISKMTDLLVLDHHASAQLQCEGLNFCEFDMKRSGAGMSWDHFFPGHDRPWFIDYVEDRDIWKWEFGNSREALAYIDTLPKTFETFDKLELGMPTLGDCVSMGQAICEYIAQYNTQVTEAGLRYITFQDPSGETHVDIPIINAPAFGISCLLNEVAVGHKFALGYFRREDGKYQFSVRVEADSDFDGSKFASLYGGGGHVKAAGFQRDSEIVELKSVSGKTYER